MIVPTDTTSLREAEHMTIREVTTSCSALGANYFAFGIVDAIPLPNTGQGCLFTLIHGLKAKGNKDFGPICGTGLASREVVYGGEERLAETILMAEKVYDPALIYVADGCVPAIIGDDNRGVILSIKDRLNKAKIVYVDTTGFDGDLVFGIDKAATATVDQVMEAPTEKLAATVNILGLGYWYDQFCEGNAEEIRRLIEAIGLKVNCIFGYGCTRQQIEDMPKASLNVVIGDYIGLEAAKLMKKRFGVPYVAATSGMPIGLKSTERFLLEVAEKGGADMDIARSAIEKEKCSTMEKVSIGLDFWFERISVYKVAIVADSFRALGLYQFLVNELQLEPAFVALTSMGPDSRKELDALIAANPMAWNPLVLERPDGYQIREAADATLPTLMLGRSPEREWCMDHKARFMPITHPILHSVEILGRADIGFRGMRTYMHELANMLLQ